MRIRLPAVRQPDSFGLGRKRAGSLVATALLFLFTYVALVDMAWANTAVHIIFAILALAALTFVIRIRETPKLTEVALGPPVAEPATREEIEEATKYVARNYDSYAIACFINLLLNPPRSLSRVHDEVEPAGRMWRVNTSLQYRIDIPRPQGRGASVTPGPTEDASVANAPGSQEVDPRDPDARSTTSNQESVPSSIRAPRVLIPLITARKGLLFDLVSAASSKGETIPALSQWEARGLTSLAIQSLFLLAHQETSGGKRPPILSPSDHEIMARAIVAICRPAGPRRLRTSADTARSGVDEVDASIARISSLSGDISAAWRDKIVGICKALSRSYVVIVEVPAPETTNLVVRYSSLYSPERIHVSSYEKLRARLGLAPYTLDVPMTRALQADSYHFELVAPAGCYVFSHHLEALKSRRALRQSNFKLNDRQQYVRLHHEKGRSVAHLYVRRQGGRIDLRASAPEELDRWNFKSIIYLREVPPGVLGNAAMLAVLTAVIILFFTLTRAGMDGAASALGLPALVLALPAFVAGALGRGLDYERVGRTSLTAYFGLQSVVVLSLSGVLMYVLDSAKELPSEVSLALAFGDHVVHTDAVWLSLSLISLTLAIFLARQRQNATRYYVDMLERAAVSKESDLEIENGSPTQ